MAERALDRAATEPGSAWVDPVVPGNPDADGGATDDALVLSADLASSLAGQCPLRRSHGAVAAYLGDRRTARHISQRLEELADPQCLAGSLPPRLYFRRSRRPGRGGRASARDAACGIPVQPHLSQKSVSGPVARIRTVRGVPPTERVIAQRFCEPITRGSRVKRRRGINSSSSAGPSPSTRLTTPG